MLLALKSAPAGSIVLLQVCCHNPTGIDPTEAQWQQIVSITRDRNLFPFLDCAYQGLATGSLDKDNYALRLFVEQGFEMCVAQSFAKRYVTCHSSM